MRIGAENLLIEFNGDRAAIADAFLLGKISGFQSQFVRDLIGPLDIQAAEARMRLRMMAVIEVQAAQARHRLDTPVTDPAELLSAGALLLGSKA